MMSKLENLLNYILDWLLGDSKPKRKNHAEESEFYSDCFIKTGTQELSFTGYTKTIWIEGKKYTLIAKTEAELNKKIHYIENKKSGFNLKDLNSDKFLLQGFYTEEKETESNEWTEKRDVWINEYCPA